jgi:hypothetical protein
LFACGESRFALGWYLAALQAEVECELPLLFGIRAFSV